MREKRRVIVELLEDNKTNTYKVLAEILARKFSENGFDKQGQK